MARAGIGAQPAKGPERGRGYSGPDSTRPTQDQKADLSTGGTAPGGTTAFFGAAAQWSSSKAASGGNFPTGQDPIAAAKMMHYGLADEAPAEHGDVPVHPGLNPAQFRTARDANYSSPDGMAPSNSGVANDGRPASPGGVHRGESPEVLKQTRGGYRT